MRDGHATEDFSAIYEFVTDNDQGVQHSMSKACCAPFFDRNGKKMMQLVSR